MITRWRSFIPLAGVSWWSRNKHIWHQIKT
jgi:hypothetical protein